MSGERAYLAASEGLQLIDITAPASPKLLRLIETGGSVEDVASFGHHALVADGSGGLTILDVSDPRQPASLGAYRTNGYARRVVANGPVAYFLGDALHLLDLGDPARPSCLGTLDLETWARKLGRLGRQRIPLRRRVDHRRRPESVRAESSFSRLGPGNRLNLGAWP